MFVSLSNICLAGSAAVVAFYNLAVSKQALKHSGTSFEKRNCMLWIHISSFLYNGGGGGSHLDIANRTVDIYKTKFEKAHGCTFVVL